jgi:hypothetical protein
VLFPACLANCGAGAEICIFYRRGRGGAQKTAEVHNALSSPFFGAPVMLTTHSRPRASSALIPNAVFSQLPRPIQQLERPARFRQLDLLVPIRRQGTFAGDEQPLGLCKLPPRGEALGESPLGLRRRRVIRSKQRRPPLKHVTECNRHCSRGELPYTSGMAAARESSISLERCGRPHRLAARAMAWPPGGPAQAFSRRETHRGDRSD